MKNRYLPGLLLLVLFVISVSGCAGEEKPCAKEGEAIAYYPGGVPSKDCCIGLIPKAPEGYVGGAYCLKPECDVECMYCDSKSEGFYITCPDKAPVLLEWRNCCEPEPCIKEGFILGENDKCCEGLIPTTYPFESGNVYCMRPECEVLSTGCVLNKRQIILSCPESYSIPIEVESCISCISEEQVVGLGEVCCEGLTPKKTDEDPREYCIKPYDVLMYVGCDEPAPGIYIIYPDEEMSKIGDIHCTQCIEEGQKKLDGECCTGLVDITHPPGYIRHVYCGRPECRLTASNCGSTIPGAEEGWYILCPDKEYLLGVDRVACVFECYLLGGTYNQDTLSCQYT